MRVIRPGILAQVQDWKEPWDSVNGTWGVEIAIRLSVRRDAGSAEIGMLSPDPAI